MSPELAINGGTPVIDSPPPDWPIADEPIRQAILESLNDGSWGKYDSVWTDRLVERLRELYQVEHVLLCSSGTIAVELGLRGLGAAAGSEVVLAGYDFPGNFRAIEAVQAFPVLCDVIQGGWVMDPAAAGEAITENTSAVIVSHLHGQIAPLKEIREILQEANIPIVEDACQMPGGHIDSRPVGSLGDVAALSFGGSKLLSAGRGGALLTQSAEIYQRAKIFNSRGNEAFPLSQLQAAVLGPQLDTIEDYNEKRHARAQELIRGTAGNSVLNPLQQVLSEESYLPAYYKLPWLFEDVKSGCPRGDFINAIQAEGVAIDVGFRGFTRRSNKRCRQVGQMINSRFSSLQTVILHHPSLLQDSEYAALICQAIQKVTSSFSI
ncbi:MAG: aminotransferase class V-fold PLP-dependent enzyme [Planctomycetota bacterium]|nr:aminotransferase class V-fold PLP-dependent enzyme [Planctomycetota bacterium]